VTSWLGVPAEDGARVGELQLAVEFERALVSVRSVFTGYSVVVDWCPLSEVDARTRAWIRSIAECDPTLRQVLAEPTTQGRIACIELAAARSNT